MPFAQLRQAHAIQIGQQLGRALEVLVCRETGGCDDGGPALAGKPKRVKVWV